MLGCGGSLEPRLEKAGRFGQGRRSWHSSRGAGVEGRAECLSQVQRLRSGYQRVRVRGQGTFSSSQNDSCHRGRRLADCSLHTCPDSSLRHSRNPVGPSLSSSVLVGHDDCVIFCSWTLPRFPHVYLSCLHSDCSSEIPQSLLCDVQQLKLMAGILKTSASPPLLALGGVAAHL